MGIVRKKDIREYLDTFEETSYVFYELIDEIVEGKELRGILDSELQRLSKIYMEDHFVRWLLSRGKIGERDLLWGEEYYREDAQELLYKVVEEIRNIYMYGR